MRHLESSIKEKAPNAATIEAKVNAENKAPHGD